MYAFISREKGKAYVIIRSEQDEKALETLKAGGITILTAEEFYGM
jgi:hypothetical protein